MILKGRNINRERKIRQIGQYYSYSIRCWIKASGGDTQWEEYQQRKKNKTNRSVLQLQYQVLDQGVKDVDLILDTQWEEYQQRKKNKTNRSV